MKLTENKYEKQVKAGKYIISTSVVGKYIIFIFPVMFFYSMFIFLLIPWLPLFPDGQLSQDIAFHQDWPIFRALVQSSYDSTDGDAVCELCNQLWLSPGERRPTRSFGNLSNWWMHTPCMDPL